MTDRIDPSKITQLLTVSTRQLDQNIVAALGSARQNALARQSVHAPVLQFSSGHGSFSLTPHTPKTWFVAVLLLIALIIGTGVWHQIQEQQVEDTDVAILTDDIPIDAFLD